jgi:hypothetical protein
MIFPNYQSGSLVNLMSSIIRACGGDADPLYAPLRGLDEMVLSDAENVVLLVIDGLGYDYLQQHPNSCLYQHLHSRITSVAPPTTAASITTFLTGMAPQQHGLTGWFTYFRELGSVVTVLPYTSRVGGPSLGTLGIDARQFFGHTSIFERMVVECYSVTPNWLRKSEFNLVHSSGAEIVPHRGYQHCFDEVVRLVKRNQQRKYIYAYWPEFDSLAHEHGVGSDQAAHHFEKLDAAFAKMLKQLQGSNTVVLATADHGFVDTPPERHLNLAGHPQLKECLLMPLCGEPRLVYCYVRYDKRAQFESYVRQQLADVCDLHVSSDLITQGLFGLGEPHPELLSRVGDYTLVMKENYAFTGRIPGEGPLQMVGFHGGLSAAEIYVPLVVVGL